SEEQCTACLLLDVDPVGMVRGKGRQQSFLLDQYVNDRPYVASSFMSVALSQVLGSALNGRCKDRPELVSTPLPLTVQIAVLPVRGGEELIREIFEPLGYEVVIQSYPLDELFPDWGESPCYTVTLTGTKTLAELLNHLYVLIPVFDNRKHYFVGENELEKLLEKGAGWLADHPLKDQISRRYLKFKPSLYLTALARLVGETEPDDSELENESEETAEDLTDKAVPLNQQRLGSVMASLRASGAQSVLDLGCGEGKLLRELLADRQFEQIVGLDISVRSLEIASKRLKLKRLPERQAQRIKLLHGSLTYRDRRLEGFDAAALVEVIEHLDPPRLAALERMLFEFAHPKTIVLTTPNKEYNVMWETLPAGNVRHADHRFEWTRAEFQTWAAGIADKFGYSVRFLPVGPEDKAVGAPTQMGVFEMKKHTDT
ncbi:MAG TPA: 3' terminal RNA ribose 2'-O-methyltransferase Hen1, partial [Planctomycetaceae bacterium]|nr:3' terminal RNA ribose 2'-O-methyltransferase Hen1 [Planctomycetaceae bacterium]